MNDAEVILVTDEIVQNLPSLKDTFFRLNHFKLLRGILNHFGISDHQLVYEVIRSPVSKKTKSATLSQHIPEQVVANLFNILEREGNAEQLGSALR